MQHLSSLDLPVANKRVLEVGAGIGLLTKYFETKNCDIVSTDSRIENILELKRRYPHRNAFVLDLEKPFDYKGLGKFEIVFCYGTLYHLSNPDKALKNLSRLCTDIILVETVLELEGGDDIRIVSEKNSVTQASSRGCRPTRKYVFGLLKKYFGYAYATKTQPNYPDFILNWVNPPKQSFYRAIFIGSKFPLTNSLLIGRLPERQVRYKKYV